MEQRKTTSHFMWRRSQQSRKNQHKKSRMTIITHTNVVPDIRGAFPQATSTTLVVPSLKKNLSTSVGRRRPIKVLTHTHPKMGSSRFELRIFHVSLSLVQTRKNNNIAGMLLEGSRPIKKTSRSCIFRITQILLRLLLVYYYYYYYDYYYYYLPIFYLLSVHIYIYINIFVCTH